MKILFKNILAIIIFIGIGKEIIFAQLISNLELLNQFDVRPNQPPTEINSKYSSIWGWTSQTGREYAILACVTGTSFIDISDSSNVYECDFVPANHIVNRECKTYLNYAYISSDSYGMTNWTALQIIDMSYLPDSVHHVKNWTYGDFRNAHTIFQEKNFLYLCGGNVNAANGLTIIDITDPENPVKRGEYLRGFVHDCYVKNDTVYAAVTGINKFVILDAGNKDSITEIAEMNNLPGYSLPHSCWLSDNGKYLITADESRGPPGIIAIWNIEDLTNIELVTTYRPPGDLTSIAHNPFVKSDVLYISHHTAGLRLLDLRNPNNPVEFAFHDTYPNSNAGIIAGNWSCYPFFNSGKIISSDMQTGLYVHRIIHDPTFIENLNTEVQSFFLHQNYPNPFNPVTKIKYEIPRGERSRTQDVKLVVFDVLGKEVMTLVNEALSQGNYEVDFDGSSFANGVYFYKLETGNFSETKRMILLK
ncbi:MAG: choice-of-anchor B family protein [Ignavibacteria bacterium]|nr:choice-of-anchor B family protein [Ignavibacteria bacterium]